jgi:hypothetical protein
LDGRATPSSCLVAAVVTVALAILPIAEPTLVAKPQTPAPQEGARRVPVGRLVVVAIEDVRTPSMPFVRSLSASLPVRHGVPGGVDGVRPDRPACGVRRLSDRGVHRGRRTRPRTSDGTRLVDVPASSMGAGGHDGRPDASSGWDWPKASMRIAVLSGQGQDVQAAWLAVAGWPEAWSDAWALEVSAAWPPPSGPDPDPSAGQSPRTGDVRPTGRSRGPPCPSLDQRLPGVRRGTNRRRRCPDGCPTATPWRSGRPA